MISKTVFSVLVSLALLHSSASLAAGKHESHTHVKQTTSYSNSQQQGQIDSKTKETTEIININRANLKSLSTLAKIGSRKAQQIVQYRNEHGHFKSITDLIFPVTFSLSSCCAAKSLQGLD